MKLLVFDPINIGYSHLAFNRTLLEALIQSDRVDSIDLILSRSQTEEKSIKKLIENKKIQKVEALNNYQENKRINSWKLSRVQFTTGLINSYFSLIKQFWISKPKAIFLLSSDNTVSIVFLFLLKYLFRAKIFIFLHNNIENCKNSKVRLALWRRLLSKSFTGILLSRFALTKSRELFQKEVNLVFLPHPIYDNIVDSKVKSSVKMKYDFLVLGRHSNFYSKNNFEDYLIDAVDKFDTDRAVTLLIKKDCVRSLQSGNLTVKEYDFPLSNEKYWEMILTSRFLMIPPQAAKRITASGVHLDAITAGTPIIAPQEGTFTENVPLDGKKLLYNVKNVNSVLENALQMKNEDYNKLVKQIQDISESLSLQHYTSRIEELISNL